MTIYSPSGAVVYEAPITKSAIIRRELMGDYYIELVFDAVDRIDIGRGCYILYNNHRFEIMNNVIPDDTNQGGLRYTLRFESQQSQMKRCNVFWREGDNLEVSFALTSDISTFGQLIIDNVNAFLGGSTFSLGSVPSGAEMKTISFTGDSCWDAVATIAETFGVEWWTEEDGDNVRLCFGKLEIGDNVEFKKGDIVSSIPSKKGDDANYGTRFYVFGSTKNLPEDYGSTVEGGITNNVVEKRLHLPNGMQYIDAWPNLAPEDIVEKTVFFEDVMPTNVETITEVYSGNAEVIPGTSHKVYDVVCANSPFTLDDVIEGETIQANFTSGSLNGQTFDLELTQTSGAFNKTFRIVPKILDKDSLTILPQGEMIPRAGDTFILLNVNLPKGRIDEAEQRLLEVGREYVKKNSSDTEIYDCPTNAVYCHKNDCNYVLGQRVTLVGDMFGDGRQSRIQGYEKKLYDEYQATYTVGDNSAYSRLASLEKSIRQANYSERVGLEANIIRSKNDATIPSDFNVYSALASEEMFLSKRRGGIVKGHTNFEKGISMYGIPIVYDEETKTWVLEGNLVTTRGISAWGSLSTPVASIFEALPIDGTTIKRDPVTNELYVDTTVVGGSGGGSLDEEQLEEYLKPYATQDWVTGRGYITSSGSITGNAATATSAQYLYQSNIQESINYPRGADHAIKVVNCTSTKLDGFFSDYSTVLSVASPLSNFQIGMYANPFVSNREHVRFRAMRNTDGTWTDWKELAFVEDLSAYLSLTGGTISNSGYWSTKFKSTGQTSSGIAFEVANGNVGYLMYADGSKWQVTAQNWSATHTLLHSGNYSEYALPKDGTAVAASKLATIRSIFGQSFDGSADVRGNIFPINTSGCYYNEDGISYHTNKQYQTSILRVTSLYNVAIGGTTASEKLEVYGNVKATGGITCRDNFRTNDNYYGFSVKSQGGEDNWYGVKTYMQFDEGATMGVCRIGTAFRHQGLAIGFSTGNDYNYNIPNEYSYTDVFLFGKNGDFLANGALRLGQNNRTCIIENPFAAYGMTLADGNNNNNPLVTVSYSNDHAYVFNYKNSNENSGIVFYDDGRAEVHVLANFRIKSKGSALSGIEIGSSDTDIWQISHRGSFANNELHFYHNANGTWSNSVLSLSANGDVVTGNNLLAKGGITATNSSDERLKRNLRKFNASKVLMSLGGVWEYEYVDSEVQKNHIYEGTHYGLIYQNVKGTNLDVMCHEREDGFGALNYIHQKFISLIAGAIIENISEVEKLKRDIRHLEAKVKQLENRA